MIILHLFKCIILGFGWCKFGIAMAFFCVSDRSTSPFQFSDIAPNLGRAAGGTKQRSRVSNGSAAEDDSSVPEDIADQPDSNMR